MQLNFSNLPPVLETKLMYKIQQRPKKINYNTCKCLKVAKYWQTLKIRFFFIMEIGEGVLYFYVLLER